MGILEVMMAGRQRQTAIEQEDQRTAALLKPLLNRYGPDAAKAIGSAWMAGGPAADLANQTLAQAQQKQQSRLPLAEQLAALPLVQQQQIATEQLRQQDLQQGMGFAANQDQRAAQQLALDQQRTQAYIGNMSYDNAAKATANQITALQGALKSEADLRSEYQKAPLLVKGAQAIGSWQMLKRALDEDNAMALQAAIVATAQIQEPGLAVRNDDRIAYSGNNPVTDQLVQAFNTAMSGEGLTPGVKQRLLALGTQMAGVHARNVLQVTDEYQRLAVNTPGARSDQVTAGIGLDWDTVQFLAEITKQHEQRGQKGPGGR